jgi:beta-aspartyl-dipeptidase (metallo-type)
MVETLICLYPAVMKFTLIEHGELYGPQPLGTQSILLADGRIAKLGPVDQAALRTLEFELEVIDARGCVVTPGFIDPHAHLIGAGGEEGFASRMPEMLVSQIVCAGVTTLVGLLGTDTSTRNLNCLQAKAAQLCDEGLTAFMYTGGFELPPRTMTGKVIDDLVLIDKIIGSGEIAISDSRWIDPLLDPLAHLVAETRLGGQIGGKAGVTHFHTGPGRRRLGLLHELLDQYDLPAEAIYPTHIGRSKELLADAIALAQRGSFVDLDTVEEDLGENLLYYREHGGPLDRLTVSSDAHTPSGSSRKLYEQFASAVCDYRLPLAEVLPLFTSNVAAVLQLPNKGELAAGKDADLLVLRKERLELLHLFARGRQFVKDGRLVAVSKQEQQVAAGKE